MVPISTEQVNQDYLLTKLNIGDYLTIRTGTDNKIQGNFIMLDGNSIVIENYSGKRNIQYSEIEQITIHKPNEQKNKALITSIGIGVVIGLSIILLSQWELGGIFQ
jgi:hypothetical protein